MHYSIKYLSYLLFIQLICTIDIFTQDSLDVSGVVLNPTSTPGDYVTPEFLLPSLFDNIRVCQDVTDQRQVEVSIDVNPTDPDNVVAAWIDYSNDDKAHVAYGYSFDGGQSWTDGGFLPTDIGGYTYQGDPAVAADKDGNFFISFISFNSTGGYKGGIYVAKSSDGGVNWPENAIVRLDSEPYDDFDDKPYIAIDKTENETANYIYVAWNHKWVEENEIHFARSTDQGMTFQRQRIDDVNEQKIKQLGAMPAVDANGDVYVVWMGQVPGPFTLERNYYFTMSTDGGQNFESENIIVEDLEIYTGLGINHLNRIYPFPIIATNPVLSGHVYLTWNNKVFGPDELHPDSSDVLFIRSTDYGETWSSPINIINNGLNPSPALNDQFFPWVAVNPEGDRISIMYYDRSDFPDNDSMHIKILTSVDDGLTFTSPLRITDVPSYPALLTHGFLFMGDYNGMVYSPTGLLYPIWTDSRHGNWDIFTAPAHLKVVSNSIDSGWVTLSIPVVVEDFTKTVVWPTTDPNSSAYSYCGSGGYVPENMLENGVGYYVKFNSDQDLIYAGDFVEQILTPVCADWNIFGSISEEVSISTNVCLFPEGNSFTSRFYIYSNGYQEVHTVQPGMGHWVKVAMNGNLLVNLDPVQCDSESPEFIDEEDMDHFIISDANGKQQDLYVANLDLNPSLGGMDLTMPPPLPEIGFDARFAEGEYIKPVSQDSGVVELVSTPLKSR